ncbi:MAG: hypothetical protein NTW06_02600 [Candidatus Falkowbacteria bacterium]|nr:hypothetical protein [Candidatus Falkowbacteria bacterium]
MKKIIYLIIFLVFSSPFSVFAAPGPRGIAINQQTKECMAFWPGDEFEINELPNGWEDFYPDYYPLNIATPYGECNIKREENYVECCKQLNLLVLDYKNLNYKKDEVYLKLEKGKIGYGVPHKCELIKRDDDINGIYINKKTNECASFYFNLKIVNSSQTQLGDFTNTCLLDKNWERYDPKYLSHISTPRGECLYEEGREEKCCQQIGLPFMENIKIKSQQIDWTKQNIKNVQRQNPEKFYYLKLLLISISAVILLGFFVWLLKKKKV